MVIVVVDVRLWGSLFCLAFFFHCGFLSCGVEVVALSGVVYDDGDVELHVLGCRLTYYGQTVTNA